MSNPRPRSKIKNPGVNQVRILRVLAEHGHCTATMVNYLLPGSASKDACERALEGLFRMEYVEDKEHGAMPVYGLTAKGIAWLERDGL